MSQQDLEKNFVLAFVFSKLDNCNGVFTELSKKNIGELQPIENAAAPVLTQTPKSRSHSLYNVFLSKNIFQNPAVGF